MTIRPMRKTAAAAAAFVLAGGVLTAGAGSYKVYSTYLWHLQQPIYWPEKINGVNRYQFAYESLSGSPNYPGHPQNNLSDIFGLDDRKAAYQFRCRDSVSSMGQPDGGAQLSYAGSLIENVWSLGDHYSLGYGPTWYSSIREAMGWTTTRSRRKIEPVGFAYHHAFMPLIDKDARVKEIAINKHIWWKAWNGNPDLSDHPKGFRCSEEAFSERIIQDLVTNGYEWVIVPNHHLSRTHPNYAQLHGKGVYDPPNKADQNNAANSGGWYSGEIDGRGSTESVPFSFQPHRAKYVEPNSGTEYKIIVVPMTDLGSYRDGYSAQGIDILNMLNGYATYDRPCIALFSHDGDNAWGGGYSYYQEAVPNFVGSAAVVGYRPSTLQTFLDENSPPANDIVHVEDGAWINAENDWGTPLYANWLWPPQRDRASPAYNSQNPATYADITNGWAEDFRNWAVVMAAQNFVSTAEQITRTNGGTISDWKIQEPVQRNGTDNGANSAELAWHFFLASLDSGYMYYGASIDMEVKPSLACNKAIEYAQLAIAGQTNKDWTGPTVFNPQRYPWNPGSTNYGAHLGYRLWVAPSDFHVWTLAYDVSTITSVVLKVRPDLDGFNPIDNNDNETYAGGPSVASWQSYAMNLRPGASFASNVFNDPNINFFIMPSHIADEYWCQVTGYNNQLLDYYIEAYDGRGNARKTDIQHVFVGSEGGGTPVAFSPTAPRDCEGLIVSYNSSGRSLSNDSPVYLVITFNSWASSNNVQMAGSMGGTWTYTNAIPGGSTAASVYFHNGSGEIDDNAGSKWSVSISACTVSNIPSAAGFSPAQPVSCDPVVITYSPNGGPLKNATNVHIHVGRNGWQDVPDPDPLMAKVGTNWVYTNVLMAGTYQINCAFSDGADLWDNHNSLDWSVTVSNCPNPVTLSPTNPEDCGVLVVTYQSSNTILSGASPVYEVISYSGHFYQSWTNAMSGTPGGLWSHTNTLYGGTMQASVYFRNADGTTNDGQGNPWSTIVWACSTSPVASSATFTPTNPNSCDPVIIRYKPGNGALGNSSNVYIHVGRNGWQDVITPDPAMRWDGTNWVYTNSLQAGTIMINCCFNNGAGVWDNNYALDWAVAVQNCSGGITQGIAFAEGSPVILHPVGTMNMVGEKFDFNLSGGDAVTVDQGGFGSLGHVYLNYDATNLYVGGIGCNVYGDTTNNAMILFLSMNTLSDNAENFWYIYGDPQGLEYLHNIAFIPPVDIAIVLGDQWGDGTFTNFSLGSGYNFGQGVFYTATNSHGFWPITEATLSQFSGTSTNALTNDYDAARITLRWECAIPWNKLNAPAGLDSLSNFYLSGVLASSATNGSDRYLSGNYLGLAATNSAPLTNGNFAFSFVTLSGMPVAKPNQDSNANGIPDWWETRYFGTPTGAVASADSDNDTFSNLQEYWLGTHPRSIESTFLIDYLTSTGVYPSVTWLSVGGKTYRVDYSDQLVQTNAGFAQAAVVAETDVDDGVGSTQTYQDNYSQTGGPPTNGFRAYRVRLAP